MALGILQEQGGIAMFIYDKKLQYPVKIDRPNPRLAALIISQYGGPDGELGASLRYLSQRYSMPFDELKGLLTDIGTEASEILHTHDPRHALAYCPLLFMAFLFCGFCVRPGFDWLHQTIPER